MPPDDEQIVIELGVSSGLGIYCVKFLNRGIGGGIEEMEGGLCKTAVGVVNKGINRSFCVGTIWVY